MSQGLCFHVRTPCCISHSVARMQVLYADGDSESICLPMERVRVSACAGEALTAPTSDELTAAAQHLLLAADADDDNAKSGEAPFQVLPGPSWHVCCLNAVSHSFEGSASAAGGPDKESWPT